MKYTRLLLLSLLALAASVLLGTEVSEAAPLTFTVNSTADSGAGSLRQAILDANANAGTDTIVFNITGAGPHAIQPASSLPTITDPVIIDGYTQPGASPNTNPPGLGINAVLKIELDGSNAGPGADGLTVTAGSSTVRGLVINRFDDNGIRLEESGGNTIEGNFIGTDVTGTGALGNFRAGVSIGDGASDNTIGGTTPEARNDISGNDGDGVRIEFGGGTGNLVQGNFIGIDVTGASPLGNDGAGIRIAASPNTIGGTMAGAGNVISGNLAGVFTDIGAGGDLVQGNFIGTDVTGTAPLGNSLFGLIMGNNNTIGGTTAGARNVISANGIAGIDIIGSGNLVQGNFIGMDVTGTAPLGNADGVRIAGSNTVGGTTAGAGNDISGNTIGVDIDGGTGNLVQGNFIGTDATGTAPLGNSFVGVLIDAGSNNMIGGTTVGAGNVISANGSDGIRLQLGTTGNLLQGNFIGTDVTGTADLGNFAGVAIDGSSSNTVGGAASGAGNVISGNVIGVRVSGAGAVGNLVQGNSVGTDATGTAALGNSLFGVLVASASGNTIGGVASEAGNTIAFNGLDGVFVASGTGNAIQSNSIFANGGLGIDLGINGVTPNDPGDADGGANNLQNFPVLNLAVGNSTSIEGTLISTSNVEFRIEFFSNTGCDPSGFGEGENFLGATTVTTSGSGVTSFAVTLPETVPIGQFITATATDADNNTSEFSECLEVLPAHDVKLLKLVGPSKIKGGTQRQYIAQIKVNSPVDEIPVAILVVDPVSGCGTPTIDVEDPFDITPGEPDSIAIDIDNDGVLEAVAISRALNTDEQPISAGDQIESGTAHWRVSFPTCTPDLGTPFDYTVTADACHSGDPDPNGFFTDAFGAACPVTQPDDGGADSNQANDGPIARAIDDKLR